MVDGDRRLGYVCRGLTIFSKTGGFDAAGYEQYLERFVRPRIDLYVASSGSGSGQALSLEELRLLYTTAVRASNGRITIGANIPEQFTPRLSIEHAKLAIDAKVDIVNIYGPDGRHGFQPTDEEYIQYFDRIFEEIRAPISLCPNPVLGYCPSADAVALLCNKYAQIENVVLTGIDGDDAYFLRLQEVLRRPIHIYSTIVGSFNTLALGAAGLAGNLANLAPETHRAYLDHFAAGDLAAASGEYRHLRRLAEYTDQWGEVSARWQPMFLNAFGLPGGAGRLPPPYRNYDETEVERFATGLLALNIPEISNLATRFADLG